MNSSLAGWLPAFGLFLSTMLQACATGPQFPLKASMSHTLSPREVAALGDLPQQAEVVWGGQIIRLDNLPDKTRIEILAHPLDENQRPILEDPSEGRFMVEKSGYLESADYAVHRLITVHGSLKEIMIGKVGAAAYRYPVVESEELYLWPLNSGNWFGSRVRLGIGISISN